MIKSLHVENYQSIASADLEFGSFTVIVGENSVGKSALLRALSALAFNESGHDFIRMGSKETVVRVTTDDGHEIEWRKGSKGASYLLDQTRRFERLGAAVPEEISQTLGIRQIELDSHTKIIPQIHSQGDYGFLLRESPGNAARMLAKSTKLNVIVSAQLECRHDLSGAKADGKEAEKEGARLSEEMSAMPNTKKAAQKLNNAQANSTELEQLIVAMQSAIPAEAARQSAVRLAGAELPAPEMIQSIEIGYSFASRGLPHIIALRQAEAIVGLAVPSEREITGAREAIDHYGRVNVAVGNYRAKHTQLAVSQNDVASEEADLADAQREWDAAVAELDLCDHCPLRQGVGGCWEGER